MKTAVKAMIAIALTCGALAVAQESSQDDNKAISVLQLPAIEERVVLQEPAPDVAPAEPSTPAEVVISEPMPAETTDACCPTSCCPPPCVPTTICLVDPCGCSHEACVSVPACCAAEPPEIAWRNGIFGRQIATLCWNCCDFEARVIVTRNGKVKVRG